MLHLPTLPGRPLSLHRPWHDRLWVDAAAAMRSMLRLIAVTLEHRRQLRREQAEWRAALELDDRVLRDIGAPTWMQSQAESAREARDFERRLLGVEPRRGLRHFR